MLVAFSVKPDEAEVSRMMGNPEVMAKVDKLAESGMFKI